MKIAALSLQSYQIPLTTGSTRQGFFICITNENCLSSVGDVAPLPKFSAETLEAAFNQILHKEKEIKSIEWSSSNCFEKIVSLNLFPSVLFGVESALLTLLRPLPPFTVPVSALLMGTREEIMKQAELRHAEKFTSAKLKVSQLSFEEAAFVIKKLKDIFRLRIDVNRAWSTSESLRFFELFPLDTFDYVEEPFQNPNDLHLFPHPLAIDESFPRDLSLEQLESLPSLKALIYKPTIQGGMSGGLPLFNWAQKRGIEFVLSSCFESDIGLAHVASMAHRLSVASPVGIGTYFYMEHTRWDPLLQFYDSFAQVRAQLIVKY